MGLHFLIKGVTMKTIAKKILNIFFILLLAMCFIGVDGSYNKAYAVENDFQVDPNGVLMDYTGNGGKVRLPKTVKTINSRAFSGNTSITSIQMPNSVKIIENGAFDSCYSLKEVTLSQKLTTIGDNAFWGCTALSRISIPKSVTTIGFGAFGHCDSLKNIYVPKNVKEIGNYAFGFVYYGDFAPISDFVLIGEPKSAIQTYAEKYNFRLLTKSCLKTSVQKLQTTSKNKLKIVWKRNCNVSGYQIQISTNKHFTSSKTVWIKKASKNNYSFTPTSGKTYYIRMRGYHMTAGEKYYSQWSKTNTFRFKK